MQITQRDIAIIAFINEFGFCRTDHVIKKFNLSTKWANKLLRRLVTRGYLVKEQLFYHAPALYRVTDKAAHFSSLPPANKLSIGAYTHTIAIIELYLKLTKEFPEGIWVSERKLVHEKMLEKFGNTSHLPDGLLVLPDKKVAIEVELTAKSNKRLETILRNYSTNLTISEVWYFCHQDVMTAVKKLGDNLNFLKIYSLIDFLKGKIA